MKWDLRLYVAGRTSRSSLAIRNLERLCEEHLVAGNCRIEIVDLSKNPQVAIADQIFALPTLVRKGQIPIRKFVGSLSDTKRFLASLLSAFFNVTITNLLPLSFAQTAEELPRENLPGARQDQVQGFARLASDRDDVIAHTHDATFSACFEPIHLIHHDQLSYCRFQLKTRPLKTGAQAAISAGTE